MADMILDEARPLERDRWDAFVEGSLNGTLFHQRAFLAYHGDRFAGQERFLVVRRGDSVLAQIALAVREDEVGRRIALSPYGGSVGGFVFQRPPTYAEGRAIVATFVDYLRTAGIHRARLTPPPAFYANDSLDTFCFTLLEAGFHSINRDITNAVALSPETSVMSQSARRKERKAQNAGIVIEHGAGVDAFWPLLEATFAKHQARPTHDRDQLSTLARWFPDRILIDVARSGHRAVAGLCCFVINPRVVLSFYPCQDPDQPDVPGLALLMTEAIRRFRKLNFTWLDLGTSTVGMVARPSLFQFKEGYTRNGFFRESLEWVDDRQAQCAVPRPEAGPSES